MSGFETTTEGRAYRAAAEKVGTLAAEYRRLATQLLAAADRLEGTPIRDLASRPVGYVHRSTRSLEDAVDEALVAL